MWTRRAVLAAAAGVAGCRGPETGSESDAGSAEAVTPQTGRSPAPTPPAGDRFWYTHLGPTGNPLLPEAGALRGADPVTFEPEGRPPWLVAHPAASGSRWTVATADGRVTHWRVDGGTATRVGVADPLPAGTPPVVATGDSEARLVRPPEGAAGLTAPAVVPGPDPLSLSVADDGALVAAGAAHRRLPVDALRDGRPVALGDGRYALYADPTDRYGHGALGDGVEGTTLTVVAPSGPAVDWAVTLDPPAVFEGLWPLVADLDGDGDPELVTVVADAADGARVAVFSAEGDRLAAGPAAGSGWRHRLAVAPFGPDGRPELAVVRRPHVEHVLEFYRLADGRLEVVATLEGVSTHAYGSRVLTGAVAADADGDGATELLLPTTDRDVLAAVCRDGDGAAVAWRTPLPGPVGSNVTGVALADGLAVGAAAGGTVSVLQG